MAVAPEGPIATGSKAPAFAAKASHGDALRLSQFRGSYVVLYFYPKDNTPGCTLEAKEFRDAAPELEAAGAVVVGISPDSVESHCKFAERFNLSFVLVADEDHAIAEKYGVWVEKNMYGKKYMGVQRATFLIDPKGNIAHVWPKVRPEGHAAQVVKVLRSLGG
jgi:peroxiredoxin Q/BCP